MAIQDDLTTPVVNIGPTTAGEVSLAGRGRRIGRPRGPERVPLTVRILAEHDARLTAEVELQGLSPQYLVERALAEYFARLDRLRGRVR